MKQHEAMIATLERHVVKEWLKAQTPENYASFLKPYPAEKLYSQPVGKMINRPAYDAPDCIAPV
jgi:putative SOS response-associated peptidase YedK